MVTVYGYTPSGNCWKVAQILSLTGRPYTWVETNSNRGETRTAAFLALNPNAKVPIAVLDDGAVITESNAILCHFAEGTAWMPEAGLARTRVLEWLFFEQYSHEPAIAVVRNVVHFLQAEDAWADRLPDLIARGHKALGVMEARLKDAACLAGDAPTVADLALMAYTQVAHEGGFDLAGYPGIAGWLERMRAVPGLTPLP